MQHFADASCSPVLVADSIDLGATDDSLDRMMRYFAEYGDTYRIRPPGRPERWVITDPADIKRVLVTNHRNYTKGIGLDRVRILLGNGIMVSEGDLWRRQRLMIQPAFHKRAIERFGSLIAAANERCLERWGQAALAGATLDITTEMSELTLEIILRAIFGHDYASMCDATGEHPFAVVTREPARDLAFAFRFRELGRVVLSLVRRRRSDPDTSHVDLLAMLMNARDAETGAGMTERELVDEVLTLVVAGHETTASALNWTWYLLSQHPEARARLETEVDAAAPTGTGMAEIDRLDYTQQVIQESLRLYPPGWLITRRSIGTDHLGGYAVPAGTDVLLSPYVIHRHPRYWPEPERFVPERFAAGATEGRPKHAYVPFVAGPRHCIGETLAMYEMTLHLARASRRFRLHYVDDGPIGIEARINLRTARNLKFVPELRN